MVRHAMDKRCLLTTCINHKVAQVSLLCKTSDNCASVNTVFVWLCRSETQLSRIIFSFVVDELGEEVSSCQWTTSSYWLT